MNTMVRAAAFAAALLAPAAARADCSQLPDQGVLRNAITKSVKASGGPANGGLENHMWAVLVDRDGIVCQVAFSGSQRADQWALSRVIAAQKANAANGLSLDGFALSTANLWAATQPGGSLFGLQESNLIDPAVAYAGDPVSYGSPSDPMRGKRVGGVIVFGGGLALYSAGKALGGLGVSGDTSCADHNVAWRLRQALSLDAVPAGVNPAGNDGIIYDVRDDQRSASGFGHPLCGGEEADIAEQIGAGTRRAE